MYTRGFHRLKKAFLWGMSAAVLLMAVSRALPMLPVWLGERTALPAWLAQPGTVTTAIHAAFAVWCILYACLLGALVLHPDWEKGLLEIYAILPVKRSTLVVSRFVPGFVCTVLMALIPGAVSRAMSCVFEGAFRLEGLYPLYGLLLAAVGAYSLCFLLAGLFRGRTFCTLACAAVFAGLVWLIWQALMRAGNMQEWIKLLLCDRLRIEKIDFGRALLPLGIAVLSLSMSLLIWRKREIT